MLLYPGLQLQNITLQSRHKKGRRVYWSCTCVCGNILERRDDYLRKNSNNFSCGCMHKGKLNNGASNKTWRGCGDISGMYFAGFKCKARRSNMEFTITIEEIWNLFLQQQRHCALTQLPIKFIHSERLKTLNSEETTASLDRIDSTKGYTIDNVQWVHKDVNRMKNSYTTERFLEICRLVSNLHPI